MRSLAHGSLPLSFANNIQQVLPLTCDVAPTVIYSILKAQRKMAKARVQSQSLDGGVCRVDRRHLSHDVSDQNVAPEPSGGLIVTSVEEVLRVFHQEHSVRSVQTDLE